jgi:hypothetical protein
MDGSPPPFFLSMGLSLSIKPGPLTAHGLYNKRHLVELSNIETVGLSNGHWEGLLDSWSVGWSDSSTVPMLDTLTLRQSESPDIGQSDSLSVQYFQ